jgi:hypothetical protein
MVFTALLKSPLFLCAVIRVTLMQGPQYVCTSFWTFICISCSGIQ